MNILDNVFYGNSIERWLFVILMISAGVILAWLVTEATGIIFRTITRKTRSVLDDIIVAKAKRPLFALLVLLSVRYALGQLIFLPAIEDKITRGLIFLVIIVITWLVSRIIDAIIGEVFDPKRKPEDSAQWDTFSPILQKGISIGIWTIGFITALNNAGFDVGALLAGLGIGGLALALASQDTVKNVIGGLIIVFDKPFRTGDRVKVDAFDGFVEDIGLRSTRLRSIEGRIISIPNALFSDKPIVNISLEPERKILITISFSHENDNMKMAQAQKLIREVLLEHPEVNSENFDIFTSGFGPFGIEVTAIYFIKLGNIFTTVQGEVNQQIRTHFYNHGIKLAISELR